jgi:hypothetical protein
MPAARRNTRRTSSKPAASKAPKRQPAKRREYEETPDWGTAFHREDNTPPQPQLTGVGVLSQETIEAIIESHGSFQIAIWTKDRDGEPLRNRNGSRRMRIHIEPPYEDPDDDQEDDDEPDYAGDPDDDIPF